MRIIFQLIIVFLLCLQTSCTREFDSVKSIYQWINNPANGLIRSRTIEGFTLTLKYLPPQFVALRDTKESEKPDEKTYDSLLNLYNKSYTFLLTIASTENADKNDPMYAGLEGIPDFKVRAGILNFDMPDYISIKTPTSEYRPVLTSMENTYGLKGQRNIYMVFTDDAAENNLMQEKELDIVFNDEIFQTGISHFVFNKDELQSVPGVDFTKIN
jgi:hypothetical protein